MPDISGICRSHRIDVELAVILQHAQRLLPAERGLHSCMSPSMRRYAFSSKASSSTARMRRRENPRDGGRVGAGGDRRHRRRGGGQAHAEIAPAPGRLSTVISPPSERTMPGEIGRPRPVPTPRGLVVKNESKIRGDDLGRDAGAVVLHLDDDVAALVEAADRHHVALDVRLVQRLRGVR